MRSGANVVHLCTKPPHMRMRAPTRQNRTDGDDGSDDDDCDAASVSGSECSGDGDTDAAGGKPLRFMDGTLEQYECRPCDTTGNSYWEAMLYPYFHRHYRTVLGKNIPKTSRRAGKYWRCTQSGVPYAADDGGTNDDARAEVGLGAGDGADGDAPAGAIIPSARYVVPRQAKSDAPQPVAIKWLEPDQHGEHYLYQQLVLKTSFRDSTPSSFISDSNITGTMFEELSVRGILREGGLEQLLEEDAKARLRNTEQREAMRERLKNHEAVMAAVNEGDVDAVHSAAAHGAGDDTMTEEDLRRLRNDIESQRTGNETAVPQPDLRYTTETIDGEIVTVATWHETADTVWRLRRRQLLAFELLKYAGDKQLLSFLSGEGGMGKSLLIRLLVQWWRSQGKRVLVCASTAKAARLIGGHTVHSAFKLTRTGSFTTSRIDAEKHSPHWAWLYTRDIIVVDEVSMLTAGALHGVNQALNHVMSLAASSTSTTQHFGQKSVLAVGDLFQLPAVERYQFSDQIYMSTLWPAFRYLYLDESCRQDATERRFAQLLSNLRLGADNLSAADIELLKTRVCGHHQHGTPATFTFDDRIRKANRTSMRRTQRDSTSADGRDMYTMTQRCHCAVARNATVVAALCEKVNTLNARHEADVKSGGVPVISAEAIDRFVGGGLLSDERARERVDKKARGQLRSLGVYVGMRAILTRNEDVEADHLNGSPGEVAAVETNAEGDLEILLFKPDSASATAAPLRISRRLVKVACKGVGVVTRYQFPVLPSHAITVHRVQGATLDNDVHVLLNSEFFAPGQAYTALSRARRLSQLHLWGFDLKAIIADPRVAREYKRLERRLLTQEHVDAAQSRVSAPLPHLSQIEAQYPTTAGYAVYNM